MIETSSGVPVFWNTDEATFVMDAAGTSELPLVQAEQALRLALNTWTQVDGADLSLRYGGTVTDQVPGYQGEGNRNLVAFIDSDWTYGREALAITLNTWSVPTGNLLDADILVNTADFDFATDGRSRHIDLVSALAHELGHAIGLGHSEHANATMYASLRSGDTSKRALYVDDKNGLRFLYGDADYIEPDPEPTPPADDELDTAPNPSGDSPADRANDPGPGADSNDPVTLPPVRDRDAAPASDAMACQAAPGGSGGLAGWLLFSLGLLLVGQRRSGRRTS